MIHYITPAQLFEWIKQEKPHQLIDIREEHEVVTFNIGGKHIPMDKVLSNSKYIERDIPVVIHCQSGRRSAAVVYALQQKFGYDNLYSLEGGITAWAELVESTNQKK